MTKNISRKNTGIFLLIAGIVLVSFGFLSQNTELFKGQLSLTAGNTSPNLTLEVSNCSVDTCLSPALILNTQEKLENVELLVKSALNSEVVYAEYLPVIESGSRYEIAFDENLCGTYNFDSLNSKYSIASSDTCTESTFDFIVSGTAGNSSLPVFTEYTSFTLTQ